MFGDVGSAVFDTGLDAITKAVDSSIAEGNIINGDIILDDDNITANDGEIESERNEEVGGSSVLLSTLFLGVVSVTLGLRSVREAEDVHNT